MSQAIIGQDMGTVSQYAAVLEAGGNPMSVCKASQSINRFFAEDDFDHDTHFAGIGSKAKVGPKANMASRCVGACLQRIGHSVGERIRCEVLCDGRADYGEQIVSTLWQQLSWSHFIEILPLKTPLERAYAA